MFKLLGFFLVVLEDVTESPTRLYLLTKSSPFVHSSDSPHCEPPLVEEPAPDTISVSRNSDDGA